MTRLLRAWFPQKPTPFITVTISLSHDSLKELSSAQLEAMMRGIADVVRVGAVVSDA